MAKPLSHGFNLKSFAESLLYAQWVEIVFEIETPDAASTEFRQISIPLDWIVRIFYENDEALPVQWFRGKRLFELELTRVSDGKI